MKNFQHQTRDVFLALFSVEGTVSEMRDKFIQVSQENVLCDLMVGSRVPKEPLSGCQKDDVAKDDRNHRLTGIKKNDVRNFGVHSENIGGAEAIWINEDHGNSSRCHSEDSPRTSQTSSKSSGNKMNVSALLM